MNPLYSRHFVCCSQMATDINVHHEVLRAHLKDCFGYEIATEGDSFKCVFRTVEDAVMYCVLVQLDLLAAPWRIETGGNEILQGTPTWADINRPKLSEARERIITEQCTKSSESLLGKQKHRATLFPPGVAGATRYSQQWLNSEASAMKRMANVIRVHCCCPASPYPLSGIKRGLLRHDSSNRMCHPNWVLQRGELQS